MEKILGIDLGTNSIGLALRVGNKFEWFGVHTFRKGVGEGKNGEFSLAAERTKHRSSRRLYNARRYRKWKTLEVLIQHDFCPLPLESLLRWKNYRKGVGRVYPVDHEAFNQWIKLDFNQDGQPDYSSPYQLRRELIQHKLDLSEKKNRYKVGRAFYHIAQRRGFKSNRKIGDKEKSAIYEGSSETKTVGKNDYEKLVIEKGSLGSALAYLEDQGIRIRNRYTLRSDHLEEIIKILTFQNLQGSSIYDGIQKAIFFQRPLRSQKGLIGKCTMEPQKPRCPVSHPKYEEFRAWAYINNLKYHDKKEQQWKQLPLELRKDLYSHVFMRLKSSFPFGDIRKFIEKKGDKEWKLNYKKTADKVSVPGCPVSARLKSVFGDDWINFSCTIKRTNKKGKQKKVTYEIEDIWHILFSFEDEEYFEEFIKKNLKSDEECVKGLLTLWRQFPVGYANLSLKALENILPFLQDGLIYSEAVLLAKIPELIGKKQFENNKLLIAETIKVEIGKNRCERQYVAIANALISKYYLLDYTQRFGWKNFNYVLDKVDKEDVLKACIDYFGNETWKCKNEKEQEDIREKVEKKYQSFFSDQLRKHIKPPNLSNHIKECLAGLFENLTDLQLEKLYHPSQVDIYPSPDDQLYLGSPVTRAFKNPMAYKTLQYLRRVVNHLIEIGKIDEETRVVVEVARELNDANKRWAIEHYQRAREIENQEFAVAISELRKDPEFYGVADPNSKDDKEKFKLWFEQLNNSNEVLKAINSTKDSVKKYRLWKEQECVCMYTGKLINLTDLFTANRVDFEHTIPRSLSFDNSMANLTVCYSHYNRNIKKNKIPKELVNYSKDTEEGSAIEPRLKAWKEKVDNLKYQIEFQKFLSKTALDKSAKDRAIRTKYLRQFEYDYWKEKLDRFTREDVPSGFRNSQLIDTQIISKYAFHYLKTVFNRVEIQKGAVTAEFRKIFGIQPKKEKKSRAKHHHHAQDAAVLTLIPSPSNRQEILRKSYEYSEKHEGKQYTELPFAGFKHRQIVDIEKTILVNNIANKDQVLSRGKKIVRRRGRIVWLRGKGGKLLLDENGSKIPLIAQGDSIRGQLHKEKFYGKIRIVEREINGKPKRGEDKKWIFRNDKNEFKFVIRKPIESLKKLEDLVDHHLAEMIRKQQGNKSLSETISQGVWALDKSGNKVNRIRRVRCWVRNASLMKVKEQTYKSKHSYKNYYYADTGDNYAFGLYADEKGNKKILTRNLFQVAKINTLTNVKNLRELFEPCILIKKKEVALYHVFQKDQKVLFYVRDKNELKENANELTNRLYYIKTLFDAKQGLIQFQHHLEARTNEQLQADFPIETFGARGKNGFSKFTTDFVAPRLLLSPKNFDFVIESKDFLMTTDGKIEFLF